MSNRSPVASDQEQYFNHKSSQMIVSNRSLAGCVEANLPKIAEMMEFYDGNEVVKMLFSSEWKDREQALYMME